MKNNNENTAQQYPGKAQNRHIDRSILLKEAGSSIMLKRIAAAMALILVVFVAWAAYLELDEVAFTTGEMVHEGDEIKLRHMVGGTVTQILVHNSAIVEKGQPLIRLDPDVSRLELESIEGEKMVAEAEKIRLEALINEKTPDFSPVKDPMVRETQAKVYGHIKKALEAEQLVIESQMKQLNNELSLLRQSQASLKRTVDLVQEELTIRRKLESRGLNSRITLLQLEKEYNDALSRLQQVPTNMAKLAERRAELATTLANLRVKASNKWSNELAEVNTRLMALEKKISISSSGIEGLDVKAPVEGIIQDVNVHSAGEIVQPGEVLLSLIPIERPLVAKVRIASKDIGHVQVGQDAVLRITTYDPRRYGVARGKLTSISPSAFVPENREPYYEGVIKLDHNYIDSGDKKFQIFSGMTLTADIKTGTKTLLAYLLKPIHLAKTLAFKER
ncbi:MAG: HlyD family type I secretion periplasmic adaptor subunit [Desulfovibrionaceae bacterium]|nr:HlyD family type I secretion periplasmic adaptor subunit [Desulfovibrionaceae bacterium]